MLVRHVNRFAGRGGAIFVLLFSSMTAFAEGETSGVVTAVSGAVSITAGRNSTPARVGLKVNEKDYLKTGPAGMVQVRFSDGNSFTIYEKASVKVSEYRVSQSANKKTLNSAIDVAYGKLRFFVNPKGDAEKKIQFRSKSAVMGIRGTSGVISVDSGGRTQLHVISGRVEVFNPKLPDLSVTVDALNMTRVESAQAPLPPVPVSADVLKALVPAMPQGSSFSDDSAAASGAYNPLSNPPSSTASPEAQDNDGGEEEVKDPKKLRQDEEGENDATQPQNRPQPSNDEDSSSQQGRKDKASNPKDEAKSASQPVKTNRRVRSALTVFKPGGEVADLTPGTPAPASSLADTSVSRDNSRSATTEIQESGNGGELDVQEGAAKAMERVSTQLEQISSKTDTTVERVVSEKPIPESRPVQIKVPLPKN